MIDASVHARKKRKNLAVLLAVLGWCALIFFISMARMARGDETGVNKDWPTPAFASGRSAHLQKMDDAAKQYHDDGAAWLSKTGDRPAGWHKEYPPKSPPP